MDHVFETIAHYVIFMILVPDGLTIYPGLVLITFICHAIYREYFTYEKNVGLGLFTRFACWDMEDHHQPEQSFGNLWREKTAEIMVHFVIIPLALFVVWQAQPGSSLFSWHPTLMILGFGFFMLEAILIFSKSSSLIPSVPRATKVKYHWILQTLATLCSVGGFLAITINKNILNKPHFTSWHGFLGGLTVFFTCLQAMMGLSLLYPKLPMLNKLKLVQLKKLHALSGTIIFVLSCAVVLLGFYSNWFVKVVKLYSWAWGLCAICPVLLAATVNNQVAQAYVYRKS